MQELFLPGYDPSCSLRGEYFFAAHNGNVKSVLSSCCTDELGVMSSGTASLLKLDSSSAGGGHIGRELDHLVQFRRGFQGRLQLLSINLPGIGRTKCAMFTPGTAHNTVKVLQPLYRQIKPPDLATTMPNHARYLARQASRARRAHQHNHPCPVDSEQQKKLGTYRGNSGEWR